MKFILKLLFALLLVAIAIVVTGNLLDDSLKVVKKRKIPVAREIIFEQVNDFRKWEDWQPWLSMDTTMQAGLSDLFLGKGAHLNWKSSQFGNCDVSITHSVYPESIALFFDFNLISKNVALIYFEPVPEGTLVNFTFNITNLNLWERYLIRLDKKQIADIIELGLERLQEKSIELKNSRLGDIAIEQFGDSHAVIKMDTAGYIDMHDHIATDRAYLARFFERRGIAPKDTVFKLIYGPVGDKAVRFAYGQVMPERTWIWKTLEYYRFPAGKVVTVSHFGGINTTKAHKALQAYIQEHELQQTGTPWEIDLYNPEVDKDTSLWETKVYYPVN